MFATQNEAFVNIDVMHALTGVTHGHAFTSPPENIVSPKPFVQDFLEHYYYLREIY